uniref:CcmH/CycL/Ccl2/NrfF N-terminal domain-containing protein n=1 Tax=Palpitomonas bilix TaxID=652834 RepID=A0A7S3D3S9_9EUKA|mmetsp:Transcript_19930/g.50915  ORF Transcript_19930/g.50915 Transcript_19930/m.50915 type:complete len:127 (+) Transcript_19930:97-477(+)
MGVLARLLLSTIDCDNSLPSNPSEREKMVRAEARARNLFRTIRCLECANQAIGDSESAAASSLRKEVRSRLSEGDTEEQVRHYLVEKYGNKVSYEPEADPLIYALYAVPATLVLGGIAFLRKTRRV